MGAIEQQLDSLGSRRPKTEGDAPRRQKGTEVGFGPHISPENTSTLREDATAFEPAACSFPVSILFTVSSTGSQRLYSGNVGKVNSISCAAALSTMKSGDCPAWIGLSTYERKRPSGKFQSASVISVACGVSHSTSNEPSGRRPSTKRRRRSW